MSDNTHMLLRANLKHLRLPTMGAEFEKLELYDFTIFIVKR